MPAMDFPSNPTNGTQTADGRYYFDSSVGSTGAWRSTPLPVGGLPAGSIMAWGTNTPPANWLLADGSAVSRETYSSLFAVIGTQYGAGNGTTTFNLPDLRGRVPVGRNGGTFGTLGATGGAENVTLNANNLPPHTHPITDPGHSHTQRRYDEGSTGPGFNRSMLFGNWQNKQFFDAESTAGAGTGITVNNNSTTNTPVNNLQPYQVVNYIIKFSAGWTAGDSELATRLGVVEQRQILSPNFVINGGFDIWQRGTSSVNGIANAAFHPDRWLVITDGVGTVNSSRIDVASQGIGSQYGWRLERTAGTSRWVGIQIIEGALSLVGKTVTCSFYVRKGSALTSDVTVDLSTRASKFGSVAQSVAKTTANASLSTSTFTRVSVSLDITTATSTAGADLFELEIFANQAGASNAFFEIAGVQLEVGGNPTPFRRNAPSIQAELAACQRYYVRMNAPIYNSLGTGLSRDATSSYVSIKYPVTMRAVPSSIGFSNLIITDRTQYDLPISGTNIFHAGVDSIYWGVAHSSGATSYRPCFVTAPSTGSGFFELNAEL